MTQKLFFSIGVPGMHSVPNNGRRQSGRRLQRSLQSDLGRVLDLSVGGMRVLADQVPESETVEVCLRSRLGELVLPARLAWSKPTGSTWKFEIGLEFTDLDDEARHQLTQISTEHRFEPPDVKSA